MKIAYIMSAKCSFGLFSHMIAYYELFSRLNIEPLLYVDNGYRDMLKEYPNYNYKFISQNLVAPDILLIINISTKDNGIIEKFKRNKKDMKTYMIYHEPWHGYIDWITALFKDHETVTERIKTLGRYYFSKSIVKKCTGILLPSQKALIDYKKVCTKLNDKYTVFPLIYTDECNNVKIETKKYFSYITTATKSKNFDVFLNYIKYRSKKFPSSMFQIATSTNISSYIESDNELKNLIKQGRLIINHGHPLSNEEINHAYSISNCVWLLYNRSTQSGVLCNSFMFGTPVIASDIPTFKDSVNLYNGILLHFDGNFETIDKAYERILCNLPDYSTAARNTFLSNYYWASHIDQFKTIIN